VFDPTPYFAQVSDHVTPMLLDEWGWLLGRRILDIFRVTAMGDLFLIDDYGRIHFLDMMDGPLRLFAKSEAESEVKIRDSGVRKYYLSTFVVRGLKERGVVLGPDECYSPELPLVFRRNLDNPRPRNVVEHSSLLGQFHRHRR
jgi:hypothetical protein